MKFLVPLLTLAALSLAACTADATRRELYSPKKGDGYWTRELETNSYKNRQLKDARHAGVPPEPEAPRPFRHFRKAEP